MSKEALSIWRPFTQMKTAETALEVTSAQGPLLHRADGRSLIDAISSWWVIAHGHCEPEIIQAICSQGKSLDQVLFGNFNHSAADEVAQRLRGFLPDSLQHMFFSDNGSTAVEVALKMAVQSWRQRGQAQKNRFLAFEHAYHGDTVGAMSVGGESLFTHPYQKMLFPVLRARHGRYSFDSMDQYTSGFVKLIEENHRELAAVIIEPLIQGAGGMIMWPLEAVKRVAELCKHYHVYLIFDEIMTGFGRTGKMFALDHLGVTPDFLCLSKGLTGGALPLSLTLTTDEVYKSFWDDRKDQMFFHGHSFTANPMACAAASASLRLFKERDCAADWKRIEEIHQERLGSLLENYPIKDRRHLGTVAAVEVQTENSGYSSQLSTHFSAVALEMGVFLRPLGNVVYVLPPYSITTVQLHRVWDAIEEGLKRL